MLKTAFYYWTWLYVRICLAFYYRSIRVSGRSNIPRKGAIVFAVNHQNALIDPLLVATATGRRIHFLMRADLFRKRWMQLALSTLNMIPVFRIRDGWQSLGENRKTFERTTKLLKDGKALLIFPEGSHADVRRVRPLSRGFTKIIFEAVKSYPGLSVKVIPVGLNYSDFRNYYSNVSVHFGTPIEALSYYSEPLGLRANQLRDDVRDGLRQVTTDIPEERYSEILQQLQYNRADFSDPERTNNLIRNLNSITERADPNPRAGFNMLRFLRWPLLLLNLLPILIWRWRKREIRDSVYVATIRFAIGMTVVPIYYVLLMAGTFYWLPFPWALSSSFLLIISLPLAGRLKMSYHL